jgi:class 3 adenylate cyclase
MKFKKQPFSQGHIDKRGILWASTGNGKLIRFDPSAEKKNTDPAVPLLKNIRIGQQAVNWYDLEKRKKDSALIFRQEEIVYGSVLSEKIRDSLLSKFSTVIFDSITPFYQLPLGLVLPYNHNQITIDYGAIETNRNFMVRYQYILEGYDKEWSPITEKTSATYGNIGEGSHTFKLKARSPEGVWSEAIEYNFKVLPPWWRTMWFRIIIGITLLFLLYGIYRWRTAALRQQKRILEQTVKIRTAEVVKQKEKSDELLLNILPSEVADELKEKGYTTAKSFDEVTVLFSDIKGFTNVAEKMTAQELVKEINTYFSAFDHIIQQYGLEKIKTIGDAYVAAGGLPEKNSATAQNVIEAALAMQNTIQELKKERISFNKPFFELRIGIHTGPVVAGVVGIKKFQYDIWGDTVNLAARMEQSGVPGKINISQQTYELVKDQFNCVHRGKIEAKNKGDIDMYFVKRGDEAFIIRLPS